jgi:hypothetical protein
MQYSLISRVYPKWVPIEHLDNLTQEEVPQVKTPQVQQVQQIQQIQSKPVTQVQPMSQVNPPLYTSTMSDCDRFLQHMANCDECRRIMSNTYKTSSFDDIVPYLMILVILLLIL